MLSGCQSRRQVLRHEAHILDIPCTQRICCAQYDIPPALRLSAECVDLLSRILVVAPAQRIGVAGICAHPWFLRNLPGDLQVNAFITHNSCLRSQPL